MRPPRVRTRPSTARIFLAALGCVVFAAAAILGAIVTSGCRWFVVATPSMGETAPVGSLVITRPGTPAVGDVISFTTSASPKVYTHRVIEITDAGLRTQGDINGAADPWVVEPGQVIGVVTHAWRGMGFLYHGLPWLVLGGVVVWVATSMVAQRWRSHLRLIGAAVVFALTTLWVRPWVAMDPIGYAPKGDGVDVAMVSTGLLPIRVQARGGTYADLRPGQVGTVFTDALDTDGRFQVFPQIHMGWLGWAVLVLFCLLPFLYGVLVGFPALDDAEPDEDDEEPGSSWLHWGGTVAVVLLLVGLVVPAALPQQSTQAAWASKISNSKNTLGSGLWASCAKNSSSPKAWGAWSMGTTGSTEADITGNNHTGRYATTTAHTADDSCEWDTTKAATFNGTQCMFIDQTQQLGTQTFTLEAWFAASANSSGSGKLIGWGTSTNGVNDQKNDRHIYLDPNGNLVFGLYNGSAIQYVASPDRYDNGAWHHVVATLSGGTMTLYVDGVNVASKASVKAEDSTGVWKVGCGSLQNWRTASGATYNGPNYYTGSLSYVAIYTTALTQAEVTAHYQARRR